MTTFKFSSHSLITTLIVLYIILTTVQLYAFLHQKFRNVLVYIFTLSLTLHCLSFFFVGVDKVLINAQDGVDILITIADVIKILSMTLFVLFVLIIAKGWPVTRSELNAKPLLIIVWILYIASEIILFIWTKNSVNTNLNIHEYHTFPGFISLAIRIIFMLWFLFELRATMMVEQDQKRLKFYLHFGAGIMVWFVHLPLVAIVALQIDLIWRYKLIFGFTSAANFLAFAIVTHLMWPTRQTYSFLTRNQGDPEYIDELDYYEEHISQSESHLHFTNPNYTTNNQINGFHDHYFQREEPAKA